MKKQEQEKLNILESEIKIAELNQKNKEIVFLFGGFVIICLVGTLLLFLQLIQKGRVKNHLILTKNNELKQLNLFKNKVLSIIGHDLRSPLAQVITYQQAKISGMELSLAEEAKMNNAILSVGESGLLVLDNLLEWAHSQIEGPKFNQKEIKVWITLETIIKQFSYQIDAKKIELNFVSNEMSFGTDENLFAIVFRNLLSNAIKFSPVGASVQITCEMHSQELVLQVIDQGPGISKNVLHSISSGHSVSPLSGSMGEKGAGLGLTLTRDFVDLLGGDLNFETAQPNGTIARISLKLKNHSI